MDDAQILSVVVLAAVCLVAAIICFRRRRASAEQRQQTQSESSRNRGQSARGETLTKRLRQMTMYDEAKIERLIGLERDELRRKGRREEALEDLMERAVARWERDNA
jgi:hypothetical protein